ncbi:MAG: hypothetical protein V1781_04000 [Bacteroidota bacterium]
MKNYEFHFDIEENSRDYESTRKKYNLKEYIFMTRAGYRHFVVTGKKLKDAEENFMRIDKIGRHGFNLDDLPIRLENTPDTKNYTIEDFWNNRENLNAIIK